MSDYLTRLVSRSLGVGEVVRPRLGSLFEPRGAATTPLPVEESLELDVGRAAPPPAEPRREPEPEPKPQREPVEALQQSVTSTTREAPPPELPRYEPTLEVVTEMREEVLALPPSLPEREPEPRPTSQQPVVTPDREPALPPETVAVHEHVLRRTEPAPGSLEPHESWLEPPPQQTGQRPVLAAAAPDAADPPVVRVTIGRVDVRAVLPSATPERAAPRSRPRMTLDEYLRDGGKR